MHIFHIETVAIYIISDNEVSLTDYFAPRSRVILWMMKTYLHVSEFIPYYLSHDGLSVVYSDVFSGTEKNSSTFVCLLTSTGIWSAMPPLLTLTVRSAGMPRFSNSATI